MIRGPILLRQAANRLEGRILPPAKDRATADLLRAIAERADDVAGSLHSENVAEAVVRRTIPGYRQAVALAEIIVRGEP